MDLMRSCDMKRLLNIGGFEGLKCSQCKEIIVIDNYDEDKRNHKKTFDIIISLMTLKLNRKDAGDPVRYALIRCTEKMKSSLYRKPKSIA